MSWEGELYVFSGRFAYGTRHQCQMDTMERGADVDENITQRTTFLVLGTFGLGGHPKPAINGHLKTGN